MREQVADAASRECRQALKNVLDVGMYVVAVQSYRVQQAHPAAAHCPARRLPANSQFFLPSAIGLIWFVSARSSPLDGALEVDGGIKQASSDALVLRATSRAMVDGARSKVLAMARTLKPRCLIVAMVIRSSG
jgi:hypothetical protein